jgi:hypothetical protein
VADSDVTAELDWLARCAPAVAASPGAFDLGELMPRYARAVAAVEAALKLADSWKQFAAPGDAQDECADQMRGDIALALLSKETPQ